MPLGMDIGFGPGDFVVDGAQLPSEKGTVPHPIFGPCLLWSHDGWIKMPLGTEVDLGPGHIVLDGDPAPPSRKGHSNPSF